jgi:hypothetical protein
MCRWMQSPYLVMLIRLRSMWSPGVYDYWYPIKPRGNFLARMTLYNGMMA